MAGPGGVLVGRGYVSIRPEFQGDWSRQASSRASSAGRNAGAGFTKAFSVGLKGIGALAGVAVGANLSSAAGAAAALAPALATAGTAAGALKIGLSGVGEAFKAAFADSSADAQAAASATRAVESAQRSLADAQRGVADARVQAAERIKDAQRAVADAERSLTRTIEDAARRQKDAQQQVRDAVRDLRDAQTDARDAQKDLTEARRDATRALQDMNQRLGESRLDEREAVLRLKEAEEELKKAQAKPGTDPDALERLQIAHERAKLNLAEQRRETNRLEKDTARANKAGVSGSEQVARAQERISDAQRGVADRERAVAEARDDARRAAVDGARDVADAQRSLADAERGVAQARADGQRQVEDAQRAVADAARALADAQAAAAAQTSALGEAMSKLAPNAKAFVGAVVGLKPAWDGLRLPVQNRLFAGLDTTVTSLARTTLPILGQRLTDTAGIWNSIAKSAADAITEMAKSGALDRVLAGANRGFARLESVPADLISAFATLAQAAQPAFNKLLGQFAGAVSSFTDGLAKGFASGGLQDAINAAFAVISQLGTLVANVAGAFGQLFKAAADAGGEIVGVLGSVFGELKKILSAPEIQAQLRTLFGAVAQIVGAILPVVGAVVRAIVPLLAAIAPAIASIAKALGPVLSQLATALGAALLPIVRALMPVVEQVGLALVQVVAAITPLLQPIAQLITAIIRALAPAIRPLLDVIVSIVGALVGPLTTVIRALIPAVRLIGRIIAQVFTALEPVLRPLVRLLGTVAGLLANAFAAGVRAVLSVIRPLIPVGVELVRTVIAALAPILPLVANAITTMARGLAGLLPTIVGVVKELVGEFVPILNDLMPILVDIARTIIRGLVKVLPALVDSFLLLVRLALRPLLPLIGQIAQIMVKFSGDLWRALLPALGELVKAVIDLLVALLPILPPLIKLIALGLRLGVAITSKILPPLLRLATFMITFAVKVVAKVITWLSRLTVWLRKHVGGAFKWLYEKVVRPVWRGIRSAISTAWDAIRKVFSAMQDRIRGPFAGAWRWLRDKVIGPVWNWISSKISRVWRDGIRPAFDSIRRAVGRVGDAFRDAKDAIGKAWDKIRGLTKKPINWVLRVVWNDGIVKVWKKIAGWIPGVPDLKKLPLLAKGGTVPAGPGIFNRPTAIVGEGNPRHPEFVIPTDPKYRSRALNLWNAAGGQLMESGGIIGDLGRLVGIGTSGTSRAAKFMSDPVGNLGKLLDPLLRPLRKMDDTAWGAMVAGLPRMIVEGLKGIVAGAGGGERVSAALRFARAQVGKPYLWGGVGPSGFDCTGILSAIQNVIQGRNPYQRVFSTHSFAGGNAPDGWVRGLRAPYMIGITHAGVGHAGGTLNGVNVESAGGVGVRMGKSARGAFNPMFSSWYGFRPSIAASATGKSPAAAKAAAREMLGRWGWGQNQWPSLERLWTRESGWRWNADNPTSDAYGIPQALPGSKMASAGKDWRTNPVTQIRWGLGYIKGRYGSPAGAMSFWNRHNWYDSGGYLEPGLTMAYNGTGSPEAVLTPRQTAALEDGVLAAMGDRPNVTYQINARTADFKVRDLDRVTRQKETELRVGRAG